MQGVELFGASWVPESHLERHLKAPYPAKKPRSLSSGLFVVLDWLARSEGKPATGVSGALEAGFTGGLVSTIFCRVLIKSK